MELIDRLLRLALGLGSLEGLGLLDGLRILHGLRVSDGLGCGRS